MPSSASQPELFCPHCGNVVHEGDNVCWLCKRPLRAAEKTSPAATVSQAMGEASTALTFQLSSLMLVITLIAVGLGLFRLAPGLGILMMIVATPALVRTMMFSRRRQAQGQRVTLGEKALMLLSSAGVVVLICISALVAFCAVCFGTIWLWLPVLDSGVGMDPEILSILLLGTFVLIALAVGGLVAWKLWPFKEK